MYWNIETASNIQGKNMINRNMRCIEMPIIDSVSSAAQQINRNMRCIEIRNVRNTNSFRIKINRNMRCIEIKNPDSKKC